MLKDKANFGKVLSLTITEHPVNTSIQNLPPTPYLDVLYTFPTDTSFWKRLDDYGYFDWPEGHKRWLDVGLFHDTAKRNYSLIWVDTHIDFPKRAWVRAFPSLVATTDSNGEHLGTHPAGAWLMDKSLWQNWLDGKFPLKIKAIVGGKPTLNIRSAPNDHASVVGSLSVGQSFTLLPDAPVVNAYTWRRIPLGWIAYSLVII